MSGRVRGWPAMTDSGPPPGGPTRGNALGQRLALAFLLVALGAVAVRAMLTAVFAAAADVSALAGRQRAELTTAIAVAAAAAWDRGDSWAAADLSPVLDLTARTGADAQIHDRAGRIVASSAGFAAQAASPQSTAAIVVRGGRVGTAVIRFTGSGFGGADRSLQTALLRAIAGAAGLAALLALVTALAVDQMADTVDRHEQLCRDLVADLAHELRTLVAILQAGHEALLLDGVAEPTPDQLASLHEEVLRLARRMCQISF